MTAPLPMRAQRIAPPSMASAFLVQARTEPLGAASLRVGLPAPAPVPPPMHLPLRLAQPTHWKVGFIAGTVVGTLLILPLAAYGGSSVTPSDVLIAVVGGSLIGGVPGGLIGGLFPKRDSPESP